MSRLRAAFAVTLGIALPAAIVNSSALAPPPAEPWRWLAHRGVAQSFPLDGVDGETCTATRIRPITHPFLENTLPSMREAFRLGAAAVELDLHHSRDGVLVVFHDATLDCRTDGHGAPEEHDLAELRALDLGWGYTADGGATYPLRGTGVGLMPTLSEVLAAFPDQDLLLHLKTDDPLDGDLLADALAARSTAERSRRFVYGGPHPVERLRERMPEVRSFTKQRLKRCGLGYLAAGWAGYLPEACHDTLMLIPADLAPWLWGWPRRFEARMEGAGTRIVLVGAPSSGGWITGVDSPEQATEIPPDFGGWVWTNRLELVAPAPSPFGAR